ncbi:DMT family transporter [Campylobacter sp. FMV-PI01]|uniref:DMT family transporter n=1 Tax=Campylobacter portucalensis TaxID=2608384 RepID=A0A6L5WH52_9BACT|nr:DMT family transporter [Campylobacter portucalensis]MSN96186.1 DMT family transporter [Campylobacter portucalensis]
MLRRVLRRNLGTYYMILASLYFAVTGAFAKALGSEMSSVEVVFFRNFIGLVIVIFAIYKLGVKNREKRPFLLFFRGFIGAIALLAFFYNIATIGLGEAFTYSKTSPMFLGLLGAILLKEKLGLFAWIGIFIGFVGIIFIIQPTLGFEISHIMGLMNGFLTALAYMSVHELRKSYDTKMIILSFMLCGTFVPVFCMVIAEFFNTPTYLNFMFAKFILPTPKMWVFIILMGIFGYIFQIYMTKAYAASRHAGVVAAVGYCDIVFSTIVGVIMGDAFPNLSTIFGISLVIFSGIIVSLKQKK